MNYLLLPSLKKATCFLPLFVCLILSSQLFAQKNAPVAGDAALLTDLLKKDYNTLEPDVRREQLAKDRTIVIGTLKRYLTDGQQRNINAGAVNLQVETSFMAYKKAEQELAIYNNKFGKGTPEIDKINELAATSESCKKEYHDRRYLADTFALFSLREVFKVENQYLSFISDGFLQKYKTLKDFKDDSYAESSQESSVQKALPFIGGDLAFEVIIDGLSKFLAERIKEELTVAVIERVQEYLKNPSENDPLAELKVLLPRTQEYLLSFKASQMANFPDEIKQYIEDDLKHMPENLGNLGNTPRIRRLVEQYPELDFAVEALEFIPNLSKIKNPVDFFDLLENSRNIARWESDTSMVKFNLVNTLKLSSMLAHSLTVVDNGELRMAGADFLNAYGSEVPFYMMYVGFLHQQNIKYYNVQFKTKNEVTIKKESKTGKELTKIRVIPFSYLTADLVNVVHRDKESELVDTLISKEITQQLKETQETFAYFKNMFASIGANSEKLYASAQLIRKARKSGDGIGADTLYAFIDDVVNLTEEVTFSADSLYIYLLNKKKEISGEYFLYINNLKLPVEYTFYLKAADTPYVKSLDLRAKVLPYLSVARKTNELVYDLQKKKYATAMIKALELTTDLWPETAKYQPEYLTGVLTLLPNKGDETEGANWRKELRQDWHAKSWKMVLKTFESATTLTKNNKNNKEAKLILEELTEIHSYYLNIPSKSDTTFLRKLESLMDNVHKMADGNLFTADLDTVKKFIKDNKTFHLLVASYYAKTSLKEYKELLLSEIERIAVNKGGDIHYIFDEKFRKDLALAFETYALSYYDYLSDNSKETLKERHDAFEDLIETALYRIPKTHSFHLNEQTIKIIHFVNDMAKAESSDDVKSAIEAFALPAGSYSIKREEKFNLSLNSYPGVLASIETTWNNNKPYNSFSPSFTAPVGLSFGWGTEKGYSHSLFVPLIDVGAFTRMYIGGKSLDSTSSTDSTSFTTLPEFSFMNLFSPGAYYVFGFKKTPLSLYAGFQWGPYLREVKREDDEVKTINNYNSMRFSLGLVLDIPLWNIHTKPRL